MNVSLELCETKSLQTSDPDHCAERILASGIQGILWMGGYFTGKEPLLATIRKTRLPVLLPHANPADADITGFTVMGTNFAELTRDGLIYLAAQGHRRVAYIGGHDLHNIAPSDYLTEVKAAGLDPDIELLKMVKWRTGKKIVFDAVEQLMKLSDPPTAIFSYSDYLSLQIYEYLHREKIRIPDDVCVLTILQIGASCTVAKGRGEQLLSRFRLPGNPQFVMLGSHAPATVRSCREDLPTKGSAAGRGGLSSKRKVPPSWITTVCIPEDRPMCLRLSFSAAAAERNSISRHIWILFAAGPGPM